MKIKLLFLCIILSVYTTTAESKTITMSFSGTVTSTDANIVHISEAQVGDTVTGNFTFDTDSMDELPSDASAGLYLSDTLNLTVNGFQYSAVDNSISITDNALLIPGVPMLDAYEVVTPLRDGISGPDMSGIAYRPD